MTGNGNPKTVFTLSLSLAMATVSAAPAGAQGFSTERLYQLCHDRTSASWRDIGQWLCPAYIRGIIDGVRLQALNAAGCSVEAHRAVLPFCVPEGATGEQAIDAVLRFIETTPDTQREAAAGTVYRALAAKWPCDG